MAKRKNTNSEVMSSKATYSTFKPGGTRMGSLEDWRTGDRKQKVGCRHGKAIRDGR